MKTIERAALFLVALAWLTNLQPSPAYAQGGPKQVQRVARDYARALRAIEQELELDTAQLRWEPLVPKLQARVTGLLPDHSGHARRVDIAGWLKRGER
jgi:hypothetical protein